MKAFDFRKNKTRTRKDLSRKIQYIINSNKNSLTKPKEIDIELRRKWRGF